MNPCTYFIDLNMNEGLLVCLHPPLHSVVCKTSSLRRACRLPAVHLSFHQLSVSVQLRGEHWKEAVA